MTTPHDLTGRQFGDYVLVRKLTTGGMAHIYLGEDRKLGRRAAVKILTPDISGYDETLRERFEREAKAIGQLEHDSIVPIYQFGEVDNMYFLAMRYIEGNDLADEIKQYRAQGDLMPIGRAIKILQQVAGALDYAHRFDIIHRDVKPSNVLLGQDDKAVLTDFGLVLWQSVDQTMGTAFGTPRYMSPEQATDSMSVVPQSDIYSLAVIVYELITGKVMFTGGTPMEVALSHITDTPERPTLINPNVPPDAEAELMKALSKDPTDRHQTATAFVTALEEAYGLDTAPSTSERRPATTPETNSTVPIPPQELESEARKNKRSTQEVLASWDADDVDNPTMIEQKSPPDQNSNPLLPMIGAVVLIGVVLAGLFATGIIGDDAPPPTDSGQAVADNGNDTPLTGATAEAEPTRPLGIRGTLTPTPSPTPTPRPLPASIDIELIYNEDFLVIRNPHPFAGLSISGVQLTRAQGDDSQRISDDLDPASCIVFMEQTQAADAVPDDFDCAADPISLAPPLFWFADDADDTTFNIAQGRQIGRAHV